MFEVAACVRSGAATTTAQVTRGWASEFFGCSGSSPFRTRPLLIFLAVDIHQNLCLRHDLQVLQREICYLQDSIDQVSTPGSPSDPSLSLGGSALNPPHQPQVGKGTPVRAIDRGTDLGGGLRWGRSRPKCSEDWGRMLQLARKIQHTVNRGWRLRAHFLWGRIVRSWRWNG